ncbi:DinB family protein [Desmospora profundinema]|uniref:Damage-inducible protein DinB n=1 Tax=Desmospora profundinema TaxID=1571184 RepID=A0ABU1IIM6_9BACL|nr:DinB family protein [Desmospora profundinema]MDR6224019.1 putative damage-inducible protein DinB [Desmospora profundinema]
MSNPITMYDYHVWANQTLFNRLKELPGEVYVQEVQSIFPSISKVMSHIYIVDHGWLSVLSGESMKEAMKYAVQLQEEAECKSIEELEAMYIDLSRQFKAFISKQADLEKIIVLDNPYAGIRNTRLSEIIMHVANHGTYHRGNISAILRQIGHASTMTDYMVFLYQEDSKSAAEENSSAR